MKSVMQRMAIAGMAASAMALAACEPNQGTERQGDYEITRNGQVTIDGVTCQFYSAKAGGSRTRKLTICESAAGLTTTTDTVTSSGKITTQNADITYRPHS